MKKYILAILMLPFLVACEDGIKPEGEQVAYYWVAEEGSLIGGVGDMYFVDGEGNLVKVPRFSTDFVFPQGTEKDLWLGDDLQKNLELPENTEKAIPADTYGELTESIPKDAGLRSLNDDNNCADDLYVQYAALLRDPQKDEYQVIYLGRSSFCRGALEEHLSKRGREVVKELEELIY